MCFTKMYSWKYIIFEDAVKSHGVGGTCRVGTESIISLNIPAENLIGNKALGNPR